MSSRQEEEAGPSGLARSEVLALLGLELSDAEPEETTSCVGPMLCTEDMPDSDEICEEALDRFERQRAFQTHLLQQTGGGLDANAEGVFEFELQPYVDRLSNRLGVRERHFNTQLRQRGNFIPNQSMTRALEEGLRRAVNQVLTTTTTPPLHDQDRLYFTIASNRLHNNCLLYTSPSPRDS